jgi:hypothetical protein
MPYFGSCTFGQCLWWKARCPSTIQAEVWHSHEGEDGRSREHDICFKHNENQDYFVLDLSCLENSPPRSETALLLLLGSVQYVIGGGKRDSGMRDVALALRSGNGGLERVRRVVFLGNFHHFEDSVVETFTLV